MDRLMGEWIDGWWVGGWVYDEMDEGTDRLDG